ncbi:hypothetical protein CBL_13345 [Carabus blaptoides fortunei]
MELGKNLDEEIASSENTEMGSKITVNDYILKKKDQLKKLEMNYIYAHILKRIKACPETECTTNLSIRGLVHHILEAHDGVPKYIIQLEEYHEFDVNLRNLDHGKSYCIFILLISISPNEYDMVSDRTTMPLMVMVAKMNPCRPPVLNELGHRPMSRNMHLMNPGELLMIWICGHLQTISSQIRVKDRHKVVYEYAGNIHSVAEINFNPNLVLARGNCLLLPAQNIMQLTQHGKIPLKMVVKLSVSEDFRIFDFRGPGRALIATSILVISWTSRAGTKFWMELAHVFAGVTSGLTLWLTYTLFPGFRNIVMYYPLYKEI